MIDISKIDFAKMDGLIPAIITDQYTNAVLMLGFMNKEALTKTLETSKVTFYSRTKQRLWTKGETSGNFLEVKGMKIDCDNDTLLITAKPQGPVCHTGDFTCFGESKSNAAFLEYLAQVIKRRRNDSPDESYTAKLFTRGKNRIIQKVGEEGVEVVIAAKNEDKNEIINESADLLFHLLVMLESQEVDFSEVIDCLIKRHK